MLSFYNDASIKEKYLNQLKLHRAADEIVKGQYWEEGKGCAVGCLVHTERKPHEKCEELFNVSQEIWRLKDSIFEGLPNEMAKDFPVNFFESIPVGVDTSLVLHKFLHWLLMDKKYGVINFANTKVSRKAINDVDNLLLRKINGKEIEERAWLKASRFAGAAANSDDDSYYATEAAAYAAEAVAYATDDYAADATHAAAISADYAAGASYAAARVKQSEKLIQLMKELGDKS